VAPASAVLPDDVLRLIGDYAPVELSFLPLVSMLGSVSSSDGDRTASSGASRPLDAQQQLALSRLRVSAAAMQLIPTVAEFALDSAVAFACGVADSVRHSLPNDAHWRAQLSGLAEDWSGSGDLVPECICSACRAPLEFRGRCPECHTAQATGATDVFAGLNLWLSRWGVTVEELTGLPSDFDMESHIGE